MSDTRSPLVSIITSTYNAGGWLRPSIESILAQTYSNFELWLVDDGSTDDSMQTIADLRDPRIRIIRQANAGKPVALNRVLDCLRGDFYAIHDADDISHPCRLERQVQAMLLNPEVAGIFTGYDLLLGTRALAPRARFKDAAACARDIQALKMPSHDPTAMYRISQVADFRYEESLCIGEGYDYILRVGEKYPLQVLDECLYSYRILPSSITRADPKRRIRMVNKVLSRACLRRGIDPASLVSALDGPLESNRDLDNNLVAHFMESVVDQRAAGRISGALATAFKCISIHPRDPDYYKPLGCAVLPQQLLAKLRRAANPTDTSDLVPSRPQRAAS